MIERGLQFLSGIMTDGPDILRGHHPISSPPREYEMLVPLFAQEDPNRAAYRCRYRSEECVWKACSGYELNVYRLIELIQALPHLEGITLPFPEVIKTDKPRNFAVTKFEPGVNYDAQWHAGQGWGSDVDLDLAVGMADMLKTLSHIHPQRVIELSRRVSPNIHWLYAFTDRGACEAASMLEVTDGLTSKEKAKTYSVLFSQDAKPVNSAVRSPLVFQNGDFTPRNVVKREDGSLLLTDWSTAGQEVTGIRRFHTLARLENAVAFCYLHLINKTS